MDGCRLWKMVERLDFYNKYKHLDSLEVEAFDEVTDANFK